MNDADRKVNEIFAGLVVRKDLAKEIRGNLAVPNYVLEYLLGQYCATAEEEDAYALQPCYHLLHQAERVDFALMGGKGGYAYPWVAAFGTGDVSQVSNVGLDIAKHTVGFQYNRKTGIL